MSDINWVKSIANEMADKPGEECEKLLEKVAGIMRLGGGKKVAAEAEKYLERTGAPPHMTAEAIEAAKGQVAKYSDIRNKLFLLLKKGIYYAVIANSAPGGAKTPLETATEKPTVKPAGLKTMRPESFEQKLSTLLEQNLYT